jgi:hypothetical protein
MEGELVRPLEWVGSSKSDLREFPDDVQDHVGFALYQAQIGLKHPDVKPLSSLGSGVLEVVSDFDVPRGLCGQVPGRSVRASRLSEEVEARNRHAEGGARLGEAEAQGG